MTEQWIDAAQALKIAGDKISLCTRLHTGLINARARTLSMDGREAHEVAVPKYFWWARGHEALEQNWECGDFSTWIDGQKQMLAFGVRFPLSAVLEMVPFEHRAVTARHLSVAGCPEWISAKEAQRQAYDVYRQSPITAGNAIVEQARLGFVAARAVLAQAETIRRPEQNNKWEEREWDIPTWFWTDFTSPDRSHQDWELGRFSGRGMAQDGTRSITLSGVHFHRASLDSLKAAPAGSGAPEPQRGRKPKYDWPAAICACWGRLYRGDLIVANQSEVEKLLIEILRVGDNEPGESTVRPYASQIWAECSKP